MSTYLIIPKNSSERSVAPASEMGRRELINMKSVGFAENILNRLADNSRATVHDSGEDDGEARVVMAADSTSSQVNVTRYPALGALLISTVDIDDIEGLLKSDPEVENVIVVDGIKLELSKIETDENSVDEAWHLDAVGVKPCHYNGSGVWIGFADTGIDNTHQEFNGRTIIFEEFDQTGKPLNKQQAYDSASNGHGTHVSAIAVGKKVGIAPHANLAMALTMPSNVTGTNLGNFQQTIGGLNWLATLTRPGGTGVDIINLSVVIQQGGLACYDPIFKSIIQNLKQLNIEVIAAIGNTGHPSHGSPGNYIEVFGMGAIDSQDQLWPKCSYGQVAQEKNIDKPDYFAPGVNIYSALPNGKYGKISGTSMAAAAASGVAALIIQARGTTMGLQHEFKQRAKQLTLNLINNQPCYKIHF